MKTVKRVLIIAVMGLVCSLSAASFAQQTPSDSYKPNAAVMSSRYFEFWNADVQAKIDADIEKNRKADDTGTVTFRGFRGKYRLTWTDASGTLQTKDVVVE